MLRYAPHVSRSGFLLNRLLIYLQLFLSELRPDLVGSNFSVVSIDDGINDQTTG
jgi:hypothetical protein